MDDESIKLIFGEMIIWKAENDFMSDSVIYSAESKHFDEVGEGQKINEYMVTIDAEFGKEKTG